MRKSVLYICAREELKKENIEFIKNLDQHYNVLKAVDELSGHQEIDILLMGGDGSLNYFLNKIWSELQDKNWKVLYIPMGTANDFSKSLGINTISLVEENVNSIIKGQFLTSIPIMKCNDQYFINAASVGAPANITEDSNESSFKKIAGQVSYYVEAFKELVNTYVDHLEYELDEQSPKTIETCGFMVSQGLYVGGGVKVTKEIAPQFGDHFKFTLALEKDALSLLTELAQMQRRDQGYEFENFAEYCVSTLKVKSKKDIPVKLDGEKFSAKELVFRKSKSNIRFYLY